MDSLIRSSNDGTLQNDIGTAEEQKTNWAIYGLIFAIMVSLGRIQEIVPGLTAFKLGKVAFGLAIILLFIAPKRNDIEIFSSQQMKYILCLFLLGVISTPFSYWPGKSFNFMFFKYLNSLILLVLLIKVTTTYADLKKIVWGIVISLAILGGKTLSSGAERATSGGGTYDPNDMAFVMVVFFGFFYFSMKSENGVRRWLLLGMMFTALTVIIATQSRGGFLGLVSILTFIAIKEKIGFVKILFAGSALALLFSVIAPEGYGERISSIIKPHEDYNLTAGGGRIEIWKCGLKLIMENPLLGVGPAVFEVAEGTMHVDEATGTTGKWSAAHNSFIQIGVELGITGLIFFIFILISSLRTLKILQRELPEDSYLRRFTCALEVGFYGYFVCGFFLSQAYSPALFLLAGLTVAVSNIAKRERLFLSVLAESRS